MAEEMIEYKDHNDFYAFTVMNDTEHKNYTKLEQYLEQRIRERQRIRRQYNIIRG